MKKIIVLVLVIIQLAIAAHVNAFAPASFLAKPKETILAEKSLPLDNRYAEPSVNEVFKDNILLNLYYLSGEVTQAKEVNWSQIQRPHKFVMELKPGEVFAFHDDVLPEYEGKQLRTTNAHFNATEGFRSSGYLYGDGVCHLASLINWVAREAGLSVVSHVNHNFANIPDVPAEFGTSIYAGASGNASGKMQNLYIENTQEKPVKFVFEYNENKLDVKIYEGS